MECRMDNRHSNRFESFFKEGDYLFLKNYLYNYLLRKRAIEKSMGNESPAKILEVGSGISPVATRFSGTVYTDLSYEAVRLLKRNQRTGFYLVADGMHLPFKPRTFSHVICSEVLEHLENDSKALNEMTQVLQHSCGTLIITVPHRRCYFTNDDHFVKHYRRYEIPEIESRLKANDLTSSVWPLKVRSNEPVAVL